MPTLGILNVTAIEAKIFKDEDEEFTCNPIAKFILNGSSQATRAIENELNPKFNVTFIFHVRDDHERLEIQILDEDNFEKDNLVGYDTIELSEIFSKKYIDAWFDLAGQGEIHLILEYVPELLEKTDTAVVEHATKKVIKDKADQVNFEETQETVTEEEITEVIEVQNNLNLEYIPNNELLEKTDTAVVEHATKKVIKGKADQVNFEETQETVTEEEITEVIEV